MKLIRFIAAATLVAAASMTALAQQPAGANRPAAPASSAAYPADVKIAVIDITAFGDQKAGIGRLVNAYTTLDREFKPRRDELTTMKTRYDQILKDIDATKSVADEKTLTAKAEQAQLLEKEMKRKQEDGQALIAKREEELTAPIWEDINNALKAFAAQRGITVIFEKNKLGGVMFVVNEGVDITRAFIADYNQRNPATASTTAPGNR
ncbi:MAG TPA: OmpH family outer membrane protein [Pyrinomonadaceae bacterium]|nr:OmpH family outer membrane protein [Pyrinomonadaceae bacterium]